MTRLMKTDLEKLNLVFSSFTENEGSMLIQGQNFGENRKDLLHFCQNKEKGRNREILAEKIDNAWRNLTPAFFSNGDVDFLNFNYQTAIWEVHHTHYIAVLNASESRFWICMEKPPLDGFYPQNVSKTTEPVLATVYALAALQPKDSRLESEYRELRRVQALRDRAGVQAAENKVNKILKSVPKFEPQHLQIVRCCEAS